MVAHLNSLKILLRQGVAIRRAEDDESNFFQFNKDKAIHVPGLRLLMNEKRFLSHENTEEQENSLIADESADISKKDQLSVSFRTVSNTYEIKKEFVAIMLCSSGHTGDALLN